MIADVMVWFSPAEMLPGTAPVDREGEEISVELVLWIRSARSVAGRSFTTVRSALGYFCRIEGRECFEVDGEFLDRSEIIAWAWLTMPDFAQQSHPIDSGGE